MAEDGAVNVKSMLSGSYAGLMAEHELALAELYAAIATALPFAATFWDRLSREEQAHRRIVLALHERIREGRFEFSRPDIFLTAIRDSIRNLAARQNTLIRSGISMRQALRMTIEVEQGLLERNFFRILSDDHPAARRVLERLARYTVKHLAQAVRESRKLKWKVAGRRVHFPALPPSTESRPAPTVRTRIADAQLELLMLMVEVEKASSTLYRVYAERFPEAIALWEQMSRDENHHAAMLRGLKDLLAKGQLFRNVEGITRRKLEAELDFIREAIFTAQQEAISRPQAAQTALRIEESMTESGFYRNVQSDAPEFRFIANRLVELTREHIGRLAKEAEHCTQLGKAAAREIAPPVLLPPL